MILVQEIQQTETKYEASDVKLLNTKAWDLYAEFHMKNPRLEPEYFTERDFIEGLTKVGEITLTDNTGEITIKFSF